MGALEGSVSPDVQELTEAPSSPAPERWLAPPKIISELLLGGASWEGV